METPENIKIKAYKMLLEMKGRMLSRIIMDCKNKVEYSKDDAEEVLKLVEHISNEEKWDYCGILSKENKAIVDTLEYLLDDNKKIK